MNAECELLLPRVDLYRFGCGDISSHLVGKRLLRYLLGSSVNIFEHVKGNLCLIGCSQRLRDTRK